MKTIKILLLSMLIVSFGFVHGQTKSLKTGNMEYSAGTDFTGTAIYQYYQDPNTSEEVMHGTFKASGLSKSNFGYSSFSITGQFVNGYRNGLWTFIKQRKDVPIEGGSYSTGKLKSTQNFKNGLPNGKWKLHETWKARDLLELYGKTVWGHYCNSIEDSASTTFKDGVAVGETYCKKYGDVTKATLNNNGFIIGLYRDGEGTMTFNSNAVMTKWDADILNNELIESGEKYLTGKISKSELNARSISVDTISNVFTYMPDVFEQYFFEGVGGDKTRELGNIKRVYGRRYKFKIIE